MFEHTTEAEARKQILDLVADYCDTFHKKKEYKEGDRIPYASRVYDHSEMVNLVDSSLEFWLTSGRIPMNLRRNWQNIWVYVTAPWSTPVPPQT